MFPDENTPLKIFVGFDSNEPIAYDVVRHSIYRHAKKKTKVIPLRLTDMKSLNIYWREKDPKQNTEFTYLRFLVPHLCEYKGWAVFIDDDFLCLDDPTKILDHADPTKAVCVVKHDYKPTSATKLAGVSQEVYPRKNWSSCILYNCSHPSNRVMTPEFVNKHEGYKYHRFFWLKDKEIGDLNYKFNFLTPWYEKPKSNPVFVHYTEGGPWYPDYRNCESTLYKEEWEEELKMYESTLSTPRVLGLHELVSFKGNPIREGYSRKP
ncbi:putative glycosyltransferase [Tetraselmis virus 1]|uniref:Putative glycosyltransferase n=1 Tax=Tetraselmis virus 1 TaxID=2060617 RepID=A0A2P0VNH9_9VIRU|nr:putative glycosyltransferase [Tetraselmis virus 1]AUF82462.1 putative glycosyltransferase [Tetraselmis virus 1]